MHGAGGRAPPPLWPTWTTSSRRCSPAPWATTCRRVVVRWRWAGSSSAPWKASAAAACRRMRGLAMVWTCCVPAQPSCAPPWPLQNKDLALPQHSDRAHKLLADNDTTVHMSYDVSRGRAACCVVAVVCMLLCRTASCSCSCGTSVAAAAGRCHHTCSRAGLLCWMQVY